MFFGIAQDDGKLFASVITLPWNGRLVLADELRIVLMDPVDEIAGEQYQPPVLDGEGTIIKPAVPAVDPVPGTREIAWRCKSFEEEDFSCSANWLADGEQAVRPPCYDDEVKLWEKHSYGFGVAPFTSIRAFEFFHRDGNIHRYQSTCELTSEGEGDDRRTLNDLEIEEMIGHDVCSQSTRNVTNEYGDSYMADVILHNRGEFKLFQDGLRAHAGGDASEYKTRKFEWTGANVDLLTPTVLMNQSSAVVIFRDWSSTCANPITFSDGTTITTSRCGQSTTGVPTECQEMTQQQIPRQCKKCPYCIKSNIVERAAVEPLQWVNPVEGDFNLYPQDTFTEIRQTQLPGFEQLPCASKASCDSVCVDTCPLKTALLLSGEAAEQQKKQAVIDANKMIDLIKLNREEINEAWNAGQDVDGSASVPYSYDPKSGSSYTEAASISLTKQETEQIINSVVNQGENFFIDASTRDGTTQNAIADVIFDSSSPSFPASAAETAKQFAAMSVTEQAESLAKVMNSFFSDAAAKPDISLGRGLPDRGVLNFPGGQIEAVVAETAEGDPLLVVKPKKGPLPRDGGTNLSPFQLAFLKDQMKFIAESIANKDIYSFNAPVNADGAIITEFDQYTDAIDFSRAAEVMKAEDPKCFQITDKSSIYYGDCSDREYNFNAYEKLYTVLTAKGARDFAGFAMEDTGAMKNDFGFVTGLADDIESFDLSKFGARRRRMANTTQVSAVFGSVVETPKQYRAIGESRLSRREEVTTTTTTTTTTTYPATPLEGDGFDIQVEPMVAGAAATYVVGFTARETNRAPPVLDCVAYEAICGIFIDDPLFPENASPFPDSCELSTGGFDNTNEVCRAEKLAKAIEAAAAKTIPLLDACEPVVLPDAGSLCADQTADRTKPYYLTDADREQITAGHCVDVGQRSTTCPKLVAVGSGPATPVVDVSQDLTEEETHTEVRFIIPGVFGGNYEAISGIIGEDARTGMRLPGVTLKAVTKRSSEGGGMGNDYQRISGGNTASYERDLVDPGSCYFMVEYYMIRCILPRGTTRHPKTGRLRGETSNIYAGDRIELKITRLAGLMNPPEAGVTASTFAIVGGHQSPTYAIPFTLNSPEDGDLSSVLCERLNTMMPYHVLRLDGFGWNLKLNPQARNRNLAPDRSPATFHFRKVTVEYLEVRDPSNGGTGTVQSSLVDKEALLDAISLVMLDSYQRVQLLSSRADGEEGLRAAAKKVKDEPLPIIPIAAGAGGFLLIVLIVVIRSRRRAEAEAYKGRDVLAFENPMYDDPHEYEKGSGEGEGLYDEPAFDPTARKHNGKENPMYESNENMELNSDDDAGGYLDVESDSDSDDDSDDDESSEDSDGALSDSSEDDDDDDDEEDSDGAVDENAGTGFGAAMGALAASESVYVDEQSTWDPKSDAARLAANEDTYGTIANNTVDDSDSDDSSDTGDETPSSVSEDSDDAAAPAEESAYDNTDQFASGDAGNGGGSDDDSSSGGDGSSETDSEDDSDDDSDE